MNMLIEYLSTLAARRAARNTAIAVAAGVFCGFGLVSTNAKAGACSSGHYNGTDIDCAIILCLVGGFGPSECNAAYGCFWHRLTRVPPKPPIGFCPMGSMENSEYEDDDRDVFELTMKELESFDFPEGAESLRSVHATLYRFTKTSRFRSIDITGHFRGKKIEYVDGFGVRQVVGDAEQKITTPYNCYQKGQGEGRACSYRTDWKPIARRIQ